MSMDDKPDYQHPDYERMLPKWQRVRDVVAGQDAVHKAGDRYLPRLSDQDPKEYDAYLKRTPFYPATGRTLAGLVGMVFRKDATIEAPSAMADMIEDVTLSGGSLQGLARMVFDEVEQVGRCGVLVEFPMVEQQPVTLAEATSRNLRPYATIYHAEDIINWRVERVGNRMATTLVVLREAHTITGQFSTSTEPQLRVLRLTPEGYSVEVWRQAEKSSEWELVEGPFNPLRNGRPLPEVPFFWFGPDELSPKVQDPPMLDLADVNLSHYRNSADLEHGAHFTGLPTPFIAGVQLEQGEKIRIGSGTAIVSAHPEARGSYLEFTGQGLGALEKLLDRKEAQMAAIGARMLAPEKRQAEAADTLEMRHNGETSVLAAQARLVSQGITAMMETMREWAGIAGRCLFNLSTDFMPVRMSAQELDALVKAWQTGAISRQTLHHNLQMGEVIEHGVTVEEEEARIGDQAPALMGGAGDEEEGQ